MMNGKGWCDLCMAWCENVHLYDFWCLACGKIETVSACDEKCDVLSYVAASKCSRCGKATAQRVAKSLYPEREIRTRRD